MADNLTIPLEVEKTIKIKVEDTSAPLRRLLNDMSVKLKALEARIKVLENGN
jgi:hypothetical protein